MKKQTAVEWLIENHFGNLENCTPNFRNKINEAKAMEKEQMIQSFRKGAVVHEPEYYTWIEAAYRKEAEKYYTSTYE